MFCIQRAVLCPIADLSFRLPVLYQNDGSQSIIISHTWASLFEMKLELNLLDWNVNVLECKLELEDMKHTRESNAMALSEGHYAYLPQKASWCGALLIMPRRLILSVSEKPFFWGTICFSTKDQLISKQNFVSRSTDIYQWFFQNLLKLVGLPKWLAHPVV